MSYNKTNWVRRVVEYPNRYILTDLGGGYYEITPAHGDTITEGTELSTANMNNLEKQYEEAVAEADSSLSAHEADLSAHGGGDFSDRALIIENRTSDPANPADGQIWIRTDL